MDAVEVVYLRHDRVGVGQAGALGNAHEVEVGVAARRTVNVVRLRVGFGVPRTSRENVPPPVVVKPRGTAGTRAPLVKRAGTVSTGPGAEMPPADVAVT